MGKNNEVSIPLVAGQKKSISNQKNLCEQKEEEKMKFFEKIAESIYSTRDEVLPLKHFERFANEEDEFGLFESSVVFSANTMRNMTHIIEDIETTQGPLFAIEKHHKALAGAIVCAVDPDAQNYSRYFALGNAVLEQLLQWCEWYEHEYTGVDFPYSEINPFANQFYLVAQQLGLKMPTNQLTAALRDNGESARLICEKLNALVSAMREVHHSPEVKKLRHNGIRAAQANFKSVVDYVARLFELKTRLLVVRVDFGYQEKFASGIMPTDFLAHLKMFRASLQRHFIFEDLVGYAMKIEHGAKKGFHVHGFFFFDGSKVQQDVLRGKMIGDHWCSLIPQDIGSYFNCNAKRSYFYNGLGILEYRDSVKREGMMYGLKYIMKRDSAARILLGNARIFMKGILPKLPTNKLGRIRAHNTQLLTESSQPREFIHASGRRRQSICGA